MDGAFNFVFRCLCTRLHSGTVASVVGVVERVDFQSIFAGVSYFTRTSPASIRFKFYKVDKFITNFRDLLPKLETFVDEEVLDIILRVFPASLCTTILTVSWMTCEGHGFIAGLVVYYIRVSDDVSFLFYKNIFQEKLFF